MKNVPPPLMVLGTLVLWFMSAPLATAATITPGTGECAFVLQGEIIEGDVGRLEQFWFEWDDTLCLDSPGGSFPEGIRIAKYLSKRSISTSLQPMAECYSACALAFMGGEAEIETTLTSRRMHWTANLGFHAPYLDLPEGEFTRAEVETAYALALRSVVEMFEIGENSFGPPGYSAIPAKVMKELLRRGPSEFYMVDSIAIAQELNIEVYGALTPNWTLSELCSACDNADQNFEMADCTPFSTQKVAPDTEEILFLYGQVSYGAAYCAIRLKHDPDGGTKAFIRMPFVMLHDLPLSDDQFFEIAPELAPASLGHWERHRQVGDQNK